MLMPVRALALASLLSVSPLDGSSVGATAPDTSALEFHGFRAGARLDELALRLQGLGGTRMRCRRSRVDLRVRECRAALHETQLGAAVELWVSAIDSVAGVITLSGALAPGRLEEWRQTLEDRYGRVSTRSQGAQSMLQWVRRGRMIRLTWRLERGEKVASVSLVDGRVLDNWGRSGAASRSTGSAAQPMSRTR
jgi:hypothetical protein